MGMIELLKALLFGIVEGITEWLPISSTGHLILLDEFIKLDASEDFKEMFDVVIQLGAILAVVVIYWKKLWPFGKKSNPKPMAQSGFGANVKKDVLQMWCKVIVACLPAAVVGLLFDDWFNAHFYNAWVVAIMLILFGIAFIVIEHWNCHRKISAKMNSIASLKYNTVFWIGMFQLIAAIFPGTSRSGATIVGALLIGVSRTTAAEFTFFLAIPVMFGASLLKIVKFGFSFTGMEFAILLVGMVSAFFVSILVIRFLMNYIKKHDFTVFGWYRIVIGILVLICGAVGIIG
ncbi:MAG: undecaprenyl-diphosphate phosphatase [Ruminococcus sp.]|nr:undecaprenyl-diphosphate phosphatase [Ruminococcus sp.]